MKYQIYPNSYINITHMETNTYKETNTHTHTHTQEMDLVEFVMCTLVFRVHMTFYSLTKGYTVPGNQGIHDKLNQIRRFYQI